MTYATINPFTAETLATFPDTSDDEVRNALDSAQADFLQWKETSFGERARMLQNAAAFAKVMDEAGLMTGAFTNLYATRDQIEMIINDPRLHGVALTGSEAAGSVVAAQAGKALKKSTMELGGTGTAVRSVCPRNG